MTIRTTQTTIVFRSPFKLKGFAKAEPAGTYLLETDEELIEGVSILAYHRVAALLHLPRGGGGGEVVNVDPSELEAALMQDRES
jgi:hypothetical protein